MLTVRPARPRTGQRSWIWSGLCPSFEKLPGPDDAACARLVDDAFGAKPRFELMVAELDGDVVAYAVSFLTYFDVPGGGRRSSSRTSSSTRGPGGVAWPARSSSACACAPVELGCGRFEWMVSTGTPNALRFYEGLGAERLDTWRLPPHDAGRPLRAAIDFYGEVIVALHE